MRKGMTHRAWLNGWSLLRLLGLLGLALPAWSMPGIEVVDEGPNFAEATYERRAVDLRVKVQGGFIRHQRYLEEGRTWEFNPDWADLTLSYAVDADPETDPPTAIERSRFKYKRAGLTNVYTYDERRRIVKTDTGFRWEDKRGNAIHYDTAGKIVSYNDRNQVFVYFTRDTEGRIATVQDHAHSTILTYQYDASGALVKVTDYTGRDVNYSYASGKLQQVTDVLGELWQYGYVSSGAASGLLNLITDPTGYQRHIHYREQGGQVATQTVGGRWEREAIPEAERVEGGPTWRWVYRVDKVLKTVTQQRLAILASVSDAHGTEHYRFRYDDALKTYSVATIDGANTLRETTYNKQGEKLESVRNGRDTDTVEIDGRKHRHIDENGRTTVREYDEWRNLVKVTHPDGTTVTNKWDSQFSRLLETVDEKGVITRHTYDAKGNRLRTTEAVGLPEQRITEYTYDVYGNTTSIRHVGDATTPDAVVTMTYDAYGNLKTYTDAEGHTTEYLARDVLGNVLQYKDARGNTWAYQYDAAGNLTRLETPLARVTQYAYNNIGNLITITQPGEVVTTLVTDGRGRLTNITDPLSATTRIGYDGADRPVAITDPLNHTVRLTYTDDGQLAAITDAAGNTTSLQYGDAEGKFNNLLTAIQYPTFTQTLSYDERERLIQRGEDADGVTSRTESMAYDKAGNQTSVTDALGRVISYNYDAHQRLISWQDAAQQLTQIDYDPRDNTVSVTNARGIAIRRYVYDGRDYLTKELLPDDNALQYTYDANGNRVQSIDAKGQVTGYSYDADNRLTTVRTFTDLASSTNLANAQKTVTFTYDNRDNLTGYNDGQSSATYTYDAANRMTQATIVNGSVSLSYRYTYDAAGRKQSYTGPDGITYTYTYTPNGELASIQIPGEGTYTVNAYQWLQPTQATLPGGGKRNTTYDGFQRPTQISGLDPAANPVQQTGYTYNAVDNILGRNTLSDTYSYGYDAVDRLQSVQAAQETNAFTYDAVGNRLSEAQTVDGNNTPVTWVYDDNDRLTQRGSLTYSYDANGSLIEKTDTETGTTTYYTYNLDNRLSEVRDSSNNLIASYSYDPFGRRISKTLHSGTSSTTTHYLYADEGLVAEANSAGTVTTTYGYEPGGLWGTNPVFITQDGQVGYYHNDHLGTPQVITARSGAVLWRAAYEAFGKATVNTNTLTNNLRFPGQYYDAETQTHYNYFRDYDPVLGRYIQSDPIGLGGGINSYRYASIDPISKIDVYGLYTLVDAHNSLRERGVAPGIKHGRNRRYTDTQIFNEWLRLERSNTDWLEELIPCPEELDDCMGDDWTEPEEANPYHPGGVYEVRSKTTPGGHSNQCIYDKNKKLMKNIPAAGSADFKACEVKYVCLPHFMHDVLPYELAEDLGREDEYYDVRPIK